MQIDWLTVAAQWINFLVLMWLLRRFLYQPIVRAMDRRQQTIAATVNAAREKAAQAEQQAGDYRDRLNELESQRSALMVEAHAAAAEARERLLAEARIETDAMALHWRRAFEREKSEFQHRLQHQLGSMAIATARKVLLELTNSELEQALITSFLKRLESLPAQQKKQLFDAGHVVLACSFGLDEKQQASLTSALSATAGTPLIVGFETLADSLCGLSLNGVAYTVEWRMQQYIDQLQAELQTALTLPN